MKLSTKETKEIRHLVGEERAQESLKGLFYGLFVGDALGTTLEFKDRDTYEHLTGMVGGGPFRLQPGEWTDDSSMALALADTLINHGMDKIELLKNFTRWYRQGKFSHNGRCFDIGTTTRNALDKFVRSKGTDESPASTDDWDSGNGGIMRLAPVVVWAHHNAPPKPSPTYIPSMELNYAMELAHKQSETTHASRECLRIARIMARTLSYLVGGSVWGSPGVASMLGVRHHEKREDVVSDGFVIHTWEAACWAVSQTDNFRDALLLAVNLGDDADTVGAVAGQLAGARYGFEGIPQEWLDILAWKDYLDETFDKLCVRRETK